MSPLLEADQLLAVGVGVGVAHQDPAPAPDPAPPVTRAEAEAGQLTRWVSLTQFYSVFKNSLFSCFDIKNLRIQCSVCISIFPALSFHQVLIQVVQVVG